MKKLLLIILSLTLFSFAFKVATPFNPGPAANSKPAKPTKQSVEQYIQKYLHTAQSEAEIYNIPVAITLGQGILESASGNSELSRLHNNHFGKKWTGRGRYAIYADDNPDDRFQVYNSAWWSFRDHSKLLSTSKRYRHLCKLDRTNYKDWARGLLKGGYATNKQYDKILIRIIEQYELHKYDKTKSTMNIFNKVKKIRKEKKITQTEMAEHLEITKAYYSMIESGKREPKLSVLFKIAEILDVNPCELLTN